MTGIALPATLTIVAWALWVRRHTWACRWEIAGTLTLVFQGSALFLTSPAANQLVGVPLHTLTGMWNVEDFIGHSFYIAAATCTVYHGLTRISDDYIPLIKKCLHIIVIPAFFLRLACFIAAPQTYKQNFMTQPTPHLNLYWIVVCVTIIGLMGFSGRIFLALWPNPTHRKTASIYLFGCTVGILTCGAKIVQAVTGTETLDLPDDIWWGCCVGVAGFAFGHAHSWKARRRHLTGTRS